MAWEWTGLGAPLVAAAGDAINEVARRGKRDDERLEFARKGLAAAREDLQDPLMIEAYKREPERALVSGVRIHRRARELIGLIVGTCVFIACGVNLLRTEATG